MATSTAPSTPEQPPKVQRSFTLPAKLPGAPKPRSIERLPSSEGAVETLFTHPSGKIVSFSPLVAASVTNRAVSLEGSIQEDEVVGTLPWRSRSERTMAAGPIRLYRIPGSVAFLNSGKTLHPILRKSQCWCVDGETIFALRIRGHNYYRIELPNTCDEDRKAADDLKQTFSAVLQYETTACPFKRGFYVELPEKQITPKRPWKPKHRPIDVPSAFLPPSSGDEQSAIYSDLDASSTSNTEDEQEGTAWQDSSPDASSCVEAASSAAETSQSPENIETLVTVYEDMKTPTVPSFQGPAVPPLELGSLPALAHCSVSYDANAVVPLSNRANDQSSDAGLNISSPSTTGQSARMETSNGHNLHSEREQGVKMNGLDNTSSADSLAVATCSPGAHDTALFDSDGLSWSLREGEMSPPADTKNLSLYDDLEAPLSKDCGPSLGDCVDSQPPSSPSSVTWSSPSFADLKINKHRSIPHELKFADTIGTTDLSSPGESMATPTWPDDASFKSSQSDSAAFSSCGSEPGEGGPPSPTSPEDLSPRTRLRHHFSSRRCHSPLPLPSNVFIPRYHGKGHDVTAAVLQRTASIVLVPPARLVALMLDIAARIANGVFSGESSVHTGNGRRIPCSWESDDDNEDSNGSDTSDEDDYGIPIQGIR